MVDKVLRNWHHCILNVISARKLATMSNKQRNHQNRQCRCSFHAFMAIAKRLNFLIEKTARNIPLRLFVAVSNLWLTISSIYFPFWFRCLRVSISDNEVRNSIKDGDDDEPQKSNEINECDVCVGAMKKLGFEWFKLDSSEWMLWTYETPKSVSIGQ